VAFFLSLDLRHRKWRLGISTPKVLRINNLANRLIEVAPSGRELDRMSERSMASSFARTAILFLKTRGFDRQIAISNVNFGAFVGALGRFLRRGKGAAMVRR
jgi:hypothetical protein